MFSCKVQLYVVAASVAVLGLIGPGCTVVSVVDAVASTAVGVTKVAVKGTTAVVGAVIPDGKDDEEKKD